MKVLVIGSGGREHAIAWALQRSDSVSEVVVAPGNPGMSDVARVVGGDGDDESLFSVATHERPDLVVIGPEAPLVSGLADRLRQAGLRVFGPGKNAATLEGSKRYAKEFMRRNDIPTAEFEAFNGMRAALAYLEAYGGPLVVKDSNLAAGKGVTVAEDLPEARTAIEAIFQLPDAEVVLEERLVGEEISLLLFVDPSGYLAMPPARDYKRVGDSGSGPMTGGMGAVAPLPLSATELEALRISVIDPLMAGLDRERVDYRGVLYVGVIATADGYKVLEFNVRFGDPETQTLLPLLTSDAGELFAAVADGRLAEVTTRWREGAAVCVVLAAPGYPASPQRGIQLGLPERLPQGALLFHAGTALDRDGRPVSAGGRVLNVVGVGHDLASAVERAYEAAATVEFPGVVMRHDVGAGIGEVPDGLMNDA